MRIGAVIFRSFSHIPSVVLFRRNFSEILYALKILYIFSCEETVKFERTRGQLCVKALQNTRKKH